MNANEFIANLSAFYGQELNDVQVDAWMRYLANEEIDYPALLDKLTQSRKWMPKLSEVIDDLRDLRAQVIRDTYEKIDQITAELMELEDVYFEIQSLHKPNWDHLASRAEAVGRSHLSEHIKKKYVRLKALKEN